MARPCLGTAFQLPALEPGDGAGQRGLAQPGGEVEPAPLPRRLAPKPAGIRLPGGLPLLTSLAPQSVTVRKKNPGVNGASTTRNVRPLVATEAAQCGTDR